MTTTTAINDNNKHVYEGMTVNVHLSRCVLEIRRWSQALVLPSTLFEAVSLLLALLYTRLIGLWASGDFVSASHLKAGVLALATCAPLCLALCGFNSSRFLHKHFTHLDISPGHEWKNMSDAQHHRAEWLTSVILLLERQRQEDCYKPENSMGYKVIPWLKNNNKTKQQWQNKT